MFWTDQAGVVIFRAILRLIAPWAAVAVILALLVLTACTTARGSFCEVTKPFRPGEGLIAMMSDAEVKAVLAHNKKGEKLCGWRP